jgi:hypothetical protein
VGIAALRLQRDARCGTERGTAMSMKRTKQVSKGSGRGAQNEGMLGFSTPPVVLWAEATKDKPDGAFKTYAVTTTFVRNDLVLHPKFGKGVVTLVEGSKVEVLFEEGIKRLGHAS